MQSTGLGSQSIRQGGRVPERIEDAHVVVRLTSSLSTLPSRLKWENRDLRQDHLQA